MSDRNQETPDWSLLPHDARSFFGLESGYTRKDLKRSYNRLIRIYKPERAPDEFQRIRAAYEQLDTALRYGEQIEQRNASVSMFEWAGAAVVQAQSHGASETEPASGAAGPSTPVARPVKAHEALLNRIRDTSAGHVYAELSQTDNRTPFDYFALALLSDTQHKDDSLKFLKWLLTGLRQYPDDRGLVSLLYASLRGSFADEEVPKILLATAKVVRTDRYYALTEPLWDRLLQSRPFEDFRRLLTKCESELQDFRVEGRVAFYVHMLKAAMWLADDHWIDETFQLIDENQPQFSRGDDFELELLSFLREYIENRPRFLNGDPLRQQMDHAIREYCLRDEPDRDYAFIECQIQMASSATDVLDAFPFDTKTRDEAALIVWEWISADVRERLPQVQADQSVEGDPDSEWGGQSLDQARRVRAFLTSIEARTNGSRLGRMWDLAGWLSGWGVYLVLYIVFEMAIYLAQELFIWFEGGRDDPVTGPVAIISTAVLGTLLRLWIHARWERFCRWMALRCYDELWRREVQQYLRRSRLTIRELLPVIQATADKNMPSSIWLTHIMPHDDALRLYVSAQRYLA